MAQVPDLADLRNHLYERVEWWWQASLMLSLLTLVFTIAGLWSGRWVALTGVSALVLPILITWMRERASTLLVRADKCRRMILYADGLGGSIAAADLAEVKVWAAGQNLASAPFTSPYYSSDKLSGPQRLADIVTESAFFTEHLAAKLQTGLWIVFALALVGSIFALYFADLASNLELGNLLLAAKSIAVFIAFLISGDLALLAKKYGDLRHEARQVYERCARLRDQEYASAEEVRTAVEDYGVALLQCAPIPSWLYVRFRDSLNDIYRDTHESGD